MFIQNIATLILWNIAVYYTTQSFTKSSINLIAISIYISYEKKFYNTESFKINRIEFEECFRGMVGYFF